jgi:hypothetical protein
MCGSVDPKAIEAFGADGFKELIKWVVKSEAISLQGGYAVLQLTKGDAVEEATAELTSFRRLRRATEEAWASALNVKRKDVLVRFIKLDSHLVGTHKKATGAMALHMDVDVFEVARGVTSIYAVEEGTEPTGVDFMSATSTRAPCTHLEVMQGGMSLQFGGLGVHGVNELEAGMMRIAFIVDINMKAQMLERSKYFNTPGPAPFLSWKESPAIEVPLALIKRLEECKLHAPPSRESAKQAWLSSIAWKLWAWLNAQEAWGTIGEADKQRLDEWRDKMKKTGRKKSETARVLTVKKDANVQVNGGVQYRF